MSKGHFITFEGGEGVGKTTQIQRLQKTLRDQGHNVILTREPGGTPAAEEIRNLLSHDTYGETWTPEAEVMLLFAARAMHIKDVIAPALEAGNVILCDRYIDSTRVYQGHLQGMDMDFIFSLENKIVGKYMPDLTLVFDLDATIAMERVKSRGATDHYDRGDQVFYQALRDGFLKIAQDNPDRCIVFDASKNKDELAAEIAATISERLN